MRYILEGKKLSSRKKKPKLEKIEFLELSPSKKVHLLKKAREVLQQKMIEAEILQLFAKAERITINDRLIQI